MIASRILGVVVLLCLTEQIVIKILIFGVNAYRILRDCILWDEIKLGTTKMSSAANNPNMEYLHYFLAILNVNFKN
jgi:hypothetical protein